MQNFELISFASADELAACAASAWLNEIESANRGGKNHCVALSGGRITQKFFVATVEQAKTRAASFDRIHFFWADERCVPPTDPESNFKMASELLFVPLNISENQIHRLRGEEAPANGLKIAEEELRRFASHAKDGRPVLDLILLGMGEDGHVASLFPNAMSAAECTANCNESFLFVADSPKPPPSRISLNYAAIITADKVFVLASGAGKETAMKNSLSAEERTPLSRVLRRHRMTKIFTDLPQS